MSIISSTFSVGIPQIDGRKYVSEVHIDNLGISYAFQYLAAASADFTAIMSERAVQLSNILAQNEIAADLNGDGMPTLHYATKAQLGAFVRSSYRDLTGIEEARIARWIVNRINDGTFTDTQVMNFFNLTVTQYNNLKTQWQTWKSEYEDISSATGQ